MRKTSVKILLILAVLSVCCCLMGLAWAQEGGDGVPEGENQENNSAIELVRDMPEELMAGDFLTIAYEPAEGAAAYEASIALVNPAHMIKTVRSEDGEPLVIPTYEMGSGAYQVTLRTEMADGNVLTSAPRPLTLTSPGADFNFVVFADREEATTGEEITLAYRMDMENTSYRAVTLLGSDGQSQTVNQRCGLLKWIFQEAGEHTIGIADTGREQAEDGAFTGNLPLRFHITCLNTLDAPGLAFSGTPNHQDGITLSYTPCGNAEAAADDGVEITYNLVIQDRYQDRILYSEIHTDGSDFEIPPEEMSGWGGWLYKATLYADSSDPTWASTSTSLLFTMGEPETEQHLWLSAGGETAYLEAEQYEPVFFHVSTDLTEGTPMLGIIHIEDYSETLVPVDASVLTGETPEVPYLFTKGGLYEAVFGIQDPTTGDMLISNVILIEAVMRPARYSYRLDEIPRHLVVHMEELDPAVKWCEAALINLSTEEEIARCSMMPDGRILLPTRWYTDYAWRLEITYGEEYIINGNEKNRVTLGEESTVIMPYYENTGTEEEDPPYEYGLYEGGVAIVSKTEVAVNEKVSIYLWLNDMYLNVHIGGLNYDYYEYPQYFNEDHNVFYAEDISFPEPGRYLVSATSDPLRSGTYTTPTVEITVTENGKLEAPTAPEAAAVTADGTVTIPLGLDNRTEVYIVEGYAIYPGMTYSNPEDWDCNFSATMSASETDFEFFGERFYNCEQYRLKITAYGGRMFSEPTWVEIYRVDALTEDSAKLTVNGEKHASVTVNTPFEIRMINLPEGGLENLWMEMRLDGRVIDLSPIDPATGISGTFSLDEAGAYDYLLYQIHPDSEAGTPENPEQPTDPENPEQTEGEEPTGNWNLLDMVRVTVTEDESCIPGIPQAFFPASVEYGLPLEVTVPETAHADWYEVAVVESQYEWYYEHHDGPYCSFHLDEPGTVTIDTSILPYYSNNQNYWIQVTAGNNTSGIEQTNTENINLVTLKIRGYNNTLLSLSTTEPAAGEPFTVGLFTNTKTESVPQMGEVQIYVDDMLWDTGNADGDHKYIQPNMRIPLAGEHTIRADYQDENGDTHSTEKRYIRVHGENLATAPEIQVPEISGAELNLSIAPLDGATAYPIHICPDTDPNYAGDMLTDALTVTLTEAGEHTLDISSLTPGHRYRVVVYAETETGTTGTAAASFRYLETDTPCLNLSWGDGEEHLRIPVNSMISLHAEALNCTPSGCGIYLDGNYYQHIGFDANGKGDETLFMTVPAGKHTMEASVYLEIDGYFTDIYSNTIAFEIYSVGPMPMPEIRIPETVYENSFLTVEIGGWIYEGIGDYIGYEIELWNAEQLLDSTFLAEAGTCVLDTWPGEQGAPYTLTIVGRTAGYEATKLTIPITIVPYDQAGLMLLTESQQAYPGQYVEYRIVSHDCTMENLIIRNLRTDTEYSRTELSPYEDGSYADAVCIWQEGEYEIYATGTMADGEILETERIPLIIAYNGSLNAPAITAPNLVMKSEGSFTFSFPAVENAQSYHYSFRYGKNNSTDYMNGPCYPDQENIITVQEDWNNGACELQIYAERPGWRSAWSNWSLLLTDTLDPNIHITVGGEEKDAFRILYGSQTVRIAASAAGAKAIRLCWGNGSSQIAVGEEVTWSFTPYSTTQFLVYAQAIYSEIDENLPRSQWAWETISAPVAVEVYTLGTLETPDITAPGTVHRGRTLEVTIGESPNAEEYWVYLAPTDGGSEEAIYCRRLTGPGTIQIPTAERSEDAEYMVFCYVNAMGWESPQDTMEKAIHVRILPPAGDDMILTTDHPNPLANEPYTVSALVPMADEIRLYENGELIATYAGDCISRAMEQRTAGTRTYQISWRTGDGEWSELSTPMAIQISAPYGPLTPVEGTIPETFEIERGLLFNYVTDPATEQFHFTFQQDFGNGWVTVCEYTYNVSPDGTMSVYPATQNADAPLTAGRPLRMIVTPIAAGYLTEDSIFETIPFNMARGNITLTVNGNSGDQTVTLDGTGTIRAEAEGATWIIIRRGAEEIRTEGPVYEAEWSWEQNRTEYIQAWYTTDATDENTDLNFVNRAGFTPVMKITVEPLGQLEPVNVIIPETVVAGEDILIQAAEDGTAQRYTAAVYGTGEEADILYAEAESGDGGEILLSGGMLETGRTYRIVMHTSAPGWLPAEWEAGTFTPVTRLETPTVSMSGHIYTGEMLTVRVGAVDHAKQYIIRLVAGEEEILYSQAGKTRTAYIDTEDLSAGVYTIQAECKGDTGYTDSATSRKVLVMDRGWTKLTLPAALGTIEEEAFAGIRANIAEIPEGVTTIGENAFAGCGQLYLVILPDGEMQIADSAFSNCPNIGFICSAGSAAAAYAEAHGIPVY